MARLALVLTLLATLACSKDNSDSSDTGETGDPRDCSGLDDPEYGATNAPESGVWSLSIDTELSNSCENALGKGVHIHVGESTRLDLLRDGSCVDAQDGDGDGVPIDEGFSDEGMIYTQWSGTTDGYNMTLTGWIEVPLGGTCFLGIRPTLTATMNSSTSLTYQMDATVDISQEGMCNGGALRYVDGAWTCDGGTWVEISDACDIAMGDGEQHSLPATMPCFQSWTGAGILTD
jgi:hypothetical protein